LGGASARSRDALTLPVSLFHTTAARPTPKRPSSGGEVGDSETAQLARAIRRDEDPMARFLAAELKRLVKDVVRAQIPRDQRATPAQRRRASGRTSTRTTRSRSTASRRRATAIAIS
jgi:hypothetical protein